MVDAKEQSFVGSSANTSVGAVVTKSIKRRFEHVLRGFKDGQLSLTWPDGITNVYGQRSERIDNNAHVVLHNYQPLRRLITDGQIGFAESYMRGEWDTEHLPNLFSLIMRNEDRIGPATRGGRFSRLANSWHHWTRRNSHRGSRKNIAFHYDLGNAFYRLWLDRSMSYSSALYLAEADSLEQAQQHKIDRIQQLLELRGGEKILEIGCGWGTLANQIAGRADCDVTGISLSAEQLDYARKHNHVATSNAEHTRSRTQFEFKDYRHMQGKFDHIVSIEMFEAVGQRYWDTYFKKLYELLESGGTAVIQTITQHDDRFDAYRARPDFIQRYIFPGGMLPTKRLLRQHIEKAGFALDQHQWFGASYARTLRAWRMRFEAASKEVLAMDFDERFIKMWRYYLVYCETGFSMGHTDVGLLKIRKM